MKQDNFIDPLPLSPFRYDSDGVERMVRQAIICEYGSRIGSM